MPRRLHQTFISKAGEQRIDGPLTGDQSRCLGQRSDQVEAVALLLPQKSQYAVLDGSPSHLSHELGGRTRYHVSQGTFSPGFLARSRNAPRQSATIPLTRFL